MKTLNLKKEIITLTVAVSLFGCGAVKLRPKATPEPTETPIAEISTTPAQVSTTPAQDSLPPASVRYRQIERLARPAINEGLVVTNDYLNAFNSIAPNLDLSAAASPVVAEAASVLKKVYDYGRANGLPAPEVGDVAAGFLPDVMRIDTRIQVGVGNWAYNADAVIVDGTQAAAMLTGGRKIEDDVMDITLSYLIAGNPACGPGTSCTVPDGVSYTGGTDCSRAGLGTNPSNPGHQCLFGQNSRNGTAVFPFLSAPN